MMTTHEWFGTWDATGWVAVYVIVALLVLGALVMIGRRKKRDLDRQHAEAIRAEARHDEPRLARREAETRKLEAESEQARAEADRREAMAASQRERLERERREHAERLREADRLDPDAEAHDDATAEGGSRHRR